MWGSPERAIRLEDSDPLTTILFQVTGPAHIPWQDQRWQEFFHGYDVWVHVEHNRSDTTSVVHRACASLVQHASRSSNLAAYMMHVTRMLGDLTANNNNNNNNNSAITTTTGNVQAFSNRIAMVGKARATAGALNLLRILLHAVLSQDIVPTSAEELDVTEYWRECLEYNSRRDDEQPCQSQTDDLLHALLHFVSSSSSSSSSGSRSSSRGGSLVENIPEMYDTMTLVLELLHVLLSSQLYQPMMSSFQRRGAPMDNLFWTSLMEQARQRSSSSKKKKKKSTSWSPQTIVSRCLEWQMTRPVAPPRSIQHHTQQLAAQVVTAKGEKRGPDGMYETHLVVTASAEPTNSNINGSNAEESRAAVQPQRNPKTKVLLDATKGVLVLSSSIILLPFRLVSLALGLFGQNKEGYDQVHRNQLQSSLVKQQRSRTRDVLWLTESPIADLASTLLLLLINNERAGSNNNNNPFRNVLTGLTNNRWEDDEETTDLNGGGLPDLPQLPSAEEEESIPLVSPVRPPRSDSSGSGTLAVNFEGMFAAFGATTHTEVGALLLYTILQAAPNFAEAMAVRSDLDTLVLPLLRTLYFSSSSRYYTANDYDTKANTATTKKLSIRSCPFRSQSQLYVMIILLLLFSQDVSFGADAFRRVTIQTVPWYKERHLKGISLGSMIVLAILRSLTFNLNRLQDPFLLSNCCAVLMNLSPSIVELHEYAAMRLTAVTVACMKRYTELVRANPDADDDEDDLSTPIGMHGEVSRTLLQVIKHCLSTKNLDRNLHLIYALVYHQTDFKRIIALKDCPFRKSEYSRIQKVIDAASAAIEKEGDGRTAGKALKVLLENVESLQSVVTEKRRRAGDDDFTFTYEEEADPEIFFVPYVWEVVVCVVTSSSIEWNKDKIQVFPLLDEEEAVDLPLDAVDAQQVDPTKFSSDVSDVV